MWSLMAVASDGTNANHSGRRRHQLHTIYYLDEPQAGVCDLYQERMNISNMDIVIVTQEGIPKEIKWLLDLTKPGLRIVLDKPTHCTIGVLSKQLLEAEGIYEDVSKNAKNHTVSSTLLIPAVATATANAEGVLAFRTDAGRSKNVEIVAIDSPQAKAVQPWALARNSDQKNLTRRLYKAIANSKESFEAAGFIWDLSPKPQASVRNYGAVTSHAQNRPK